MYDNQPEIVELLLSAGVPIDLLDCDEITPIEIAVERGNREMVALLLSRGATVSIHVAAAIGNVETIDRYLKDGGDPDVRLGIGYGCPLLYAAAAHDRLDVAKLLIEAGATIDLECGQAAENGHYEMVKFLAKCQIDPNYKADWRTALLEAASHRDWSMVKLLLSVGADVNTGADTRTWTALHWATSEGHLEMTRLLVAAGAEVNAGIFDWRTPLELACENRHDDVIEFLTKNGAR